MGSLCASIPAQMLDMVWCLRPDGDSWCVRETRSRIKRLRGLSQPLYRLRIPPAVGHPILTTGFTAAGNVMIGPIGELRVVHDVNDTTVEVRAIISEAKGWLDDERTPDPGRPPDESGG